MEKSQIYKNFEKFYEENIKKLKMPKDVNYPLNYRKGIQWANSQCDSDSREFASDIIKHTLYISFSKFMGDVKNICNSYMEKFTQPKYSQTIFILIIPFNIYKSNTWVTLLIFKYLKNIIHDIYPDITDVYNDTINHRSHLYKKKVRCIICDDCAYTGHQLSHVSSFIYEKINYINKTHPPSENSSEWISWYERTNKEAEQHIKKLSPEIFAIDLMIPYMSTLAQASLRIIPWVNIPHSCFVFAIFSQYINIERIPLHILNEFKKTFQYHRDVSAIYFDHKVADTVSTFHKIYLLAPLFNCSVSSKSIPFIDNCNVNNIPENIDIYNYYVDLSDKMKTCPGTFYKSIKYTYKKKPLSKDTLLFDILKV